MTGPSVSVLLPVRNAASWLDAALASLGRQSLADHEIVAVDDGSDDGSSVILDRRAAADPRYSAPRFLACKAHHLARGPLAGRSRVILWGAGRTGRRLSARLLEEGIEIHRVVDIDPAKIGGTLRGCPVIAPQELPDHLGSDTTVLAAVASRGARDLIRTRLVELGLVEGADFLCVA